MVISSTFNLLESPAWRDYEMLDSGNGLKLERFGSYVLVRPEVQAIWEQALPQEKWPVAHATFQPTSEESGGHWVFKKKMPERWEMKYDLDAGKEEMRFWVMTTPGRHLGIFPEAASHWDFVADSVRTAGRPVKILNLFGYTGLASLAAAAAGAQVTHVDASRKAVNWARENQILSKLDDKPIRWIVDDALKFVQREGRRGTHYDGIVLDPPKFGRGPKGEIWEVYKSLPHLLEACRIILSNRPIFMIITVYAVKSSAVHMGQALQGIMTNFNGRIESGELVTREKSAGRLISQAVYARWQME